MTVIELIQMLMAAGIKPDAVIKFEDKLGEVV